jgi:hypothetical protein
MEKKVHLYFSIVMSIFMVFFMSFVVTFANIGFSDYLISAWLKSFVIAWIVAFPLIYFFAPIFKKMIMKKLSK